MRARMRARMRACTHACMRSDPGQARLGKASPWEQTAGYSKAGSAQAPGSKQLVARKLGVNKPLEVNRWLPESWE